MRPGGGELVFADTLITHWKRIVIDNPEWRPHEKWRIEAGFDHGKTNPTAFLRCYFDYDGVGYFCGEYYQPGLEVWQHAPALKQMKDIRKVTLAYADPTIFDFVMQQSNQPTKLGQSAERAKSINELYVEQGIELFSPFAGDRSDISFASRLMTHWANLDKREPTIKIVCRNYSERPQPGLHNWDCPNLLWKRCARAGRSSPPSNCSRGMLQRRLSTRTTTLGTLVNTSLCPIHNQQKKAFGKNSKKGFGL
jgi:hypothetical protein